jgi:hypothetical protein
MEILKTRSANIHDSFRLSACSWTLSTFALAAHLAGGLTHGVRLGGRGLDNPLPKAVGINRNDAANPIQKAGEAAAHVQAISYGGRLRAFAVNLARLS